MEKKSLHAEEHVVAKNLQFLTKENLSKNLSEPKCYENFDLTKLAGKKTFCTEEKLKLENLITLLFEKGKSVSQNGFTLVYLKTSLPSFYPAQATFSVSKKSFKNATDRNRIKRLMREAYRTHKFSFYENLIARKEQLAIMFIYKSKQIPDFALVNQQLKVLLEKLK